jgi:RNA-binding protein YlmH
MASANSHPLNPQSSTSIANSRNNKTNNVTIQKVEVNTQATDAKGISQGIGDHLSKSMRQATANTDDGVAA